MHYAEAPRWEVREDDGARLLPALYVRDTLGVDEPDLPRLAPSVPVEEHARDQRAQSILEQQWMWWWRSLIEPTARPGRVPLELIDPDEYLRGVALPVGGLPELREALRRCGAEADSWAAAWRDRHRTEALPGTGVAHLRLRDLVNERAAELGRPPRPFRLRIEVFPFAEAGTWWIGESTLAMSDSTRSDEAAYTAVLRPIIARLA